MNRFRYTAKSIALIVGGEIHGRGDVDPEIRDLLIDSRRLIHPDGSMFIALESERNDGHRYIPELVERGVSCFLVNATYDVQGSRNVITRNEVTKQVKVQGSGLKVQGSGLKAQGTGAEIPYPVSRIPYPGSRIPDFESRIPYPVFIMVPDTLSALQKLAAHHRQQFDYPVIGITGSNGKTIVKEWLYQLLSPETDIIRSPKSFNSQIGVPLSVWNMDSGHNLAVIEAGISKPGEMERLERIINPSIGIFTSVGPAHASNFSGDPEKVDEKLKLFSHSEVLIYRSDYTMITERLDASDNYRTLGRFTWGTKETDTLQITGIRKEGDRAVIDGICEGIEGKIIIPFTDDASIENAIHCWAFILVRGSNMPLKSLKGTYSASQFHPPEGRSKPPSGGMGAFANLVPVAMRLELKDAINNCSLINDSYNSDINSLGIALDFLVQQKQHPKRTIILSDILQTGRDPGEFYAEVAGIIASKQIDRIIGIGEEISRFRHKFSVNSMFFPDTEEFMLHFPLSSFSNETILLKGARVFGFERIDQALQQKAHETVLEINLDAVVHNLNFFRAKLNPGVKTMVMVKAFSYGSGSFEIANLLQYHQVDTLAVAFADEGVELRKAGITMPVMVMSPEEQSMETLITWNLEPEIYSLRILRMFEESLNHTNGSLLREAMIHIKLDTGMHRLGFCETDLDELNAFLEKNHQFRVRSVFSHLAASEDPSQDAFTRKQFSRFLSMSKRVTSALDYPVLMHILNSAGISRFPDMQLDMVRLGIGMYGIGPNVEEQAHLRHVSRLRTAITQIKYVGKGETVGYNRQGVAERDTVVAVVPMGYADGLSRRLGNGKGQMLVKGRRVPLIGNVCMDLCMLDITGIADAGISIEEGDEVVVFGESLPVSELAETLQTIPYEIMTGISRRVKRVYYHE